MCEMVCFDKNNVQETGGLVASTSDKAMPVYIRLKVQYSRE
jgi:hypothetical protein